MPYEPRVWVLADDRTGDVAQAVGVAEALGVPFVIKPIAYTLLGALHNAVRGTSLLGIDKASRRALIGPWPDVVIAAGRRTLPVARWIKRQSQKAGNRRPALLCQIMWPGTAGAGDLDIVAVPAHDRQVSVRGYDRRDAAPSGFATQTSAPLGHNPIGLNPAAVNPLAAASEGPAILRIPVAPHRVTAARLWLERLKWENRLAALPRPWIAVIVGGTTGPRRFTVEMAEELARRVRSLAEAAGGTLLVTTSRRTGTKATKALFDALGPVGHQYVWGREDAGENPYFGYLAVADALVVTGESVSMLSEAATTGTPVYVYGPNKLLAPKHRRLVDHLYRSGAAQPLGVPLALGTVEGRGVLNVADDIARAIRQRLMSGSPFGGRSFTSGEPG